MPPFEKATLQDVVDYGRRHGVLHPQQSAQEVPEAFLAVGDHVRAEIARIVLHGVQASQKGKNPSVTIPNDSGENINSREVFADAVKRLMSDTTSMPGVNNRNLKLLSVIQELERSGFVEITRDPDFINFVSSLPTEKTFACSIQIVDSPSGKKIFVRAISTELKPGHIPIPKSFENLEFLPKFVLSKVRNLKCNLFYIRKPEESHNTDCISLIEVGCVPNAS